VDGCEAPFSERENERKENRMQKQHQHGVLGDQQITCGKRKLLAMVSSVTSVIGLSVFFVLYGTQPGCAEAQKLSEQAAEGATPQQSQLSAKLV